MVRRGEVRGKLTDPGGGARIRGSRGAGEQPRIEVPRIDATAGKHVEPRPEVHRPGPVGQQDLEAAGAGAKQRDGRRGTDRERGRGVAHVPASSASSASGSLTG